MSSDNRHDWAIVLAAGEGTRLRELTTDERGRTWPKQFCSLTGGRSLLQETLSRAERITSTERIVVVVAAHHEHWWRAQLVGLPPANLIAQPRNLGTSPGLLLPLMHVLAQDPAARITVLPSDHHVEDEAVLARSLRRALNGLRLHPSALILLGMTPEAPETEYGWIVPATVTFDDPVPVRSFVEKPSRDIAERLFSSGALWSSFLIATRGDELLTRFERCSPHWVEALHGVGAHSSAALDRIYARMDAYDFSRQILQSDGIGLQVLRVPACGWTDLGTPRRVVECLQALDPRSQPQRAIRTRTRREGSPYDLRVAVRRACSVEERAAGV